MLNEYSLADSFCVVSSQLTFIVKSLEQDVLCITVFDRDLFSPNGKVINLNSLLCKFSVIFIIVSQSSPSVLIFPFSFSRQTF